MPNKKSIAVVRNKSSGEFLRMSKFDPETQAPLFGPLEMAWIADLEAARSLLCIGQPGVTEPRKADHG